MKNRVVGLLLVLSTLFTFLPFSSVLSYAQNESENPLLATPGVSTYIAQCYLGIADNPSQTNFIYLCNSLYNNYVKNDVYSQCYTFLDECHSDAGFMLTYGAWCLYSLGASPSSATNQIMDEEDYYETLIISILMESMSNNNLFHDILNNKIIENSNSLLNSLCDEIGLAETSKLNDYYPLNDAETFKRVKKVIENQIPAGKISKITDILGDIIKYGKNIYDVCERISVYYSMLELDDSAIMWLKHMRQLCGNNNPGLYNALTILISAGTNIAGFALSEIMKTQFVTAKLGMDIVISEGVKALAANNPVVLAVVSGLKTGRAICNLFFSTDDECEQFHFLSCMRIVSLLSRQIVYGYENQFINNQTDENAEYLIKSVDYYFKCITDIEINGYKDFLNIVYNKGLLKFVLKKVFKASDDYVTIVEDLDETLKARKFLHESLKNYSIEALKVNNEELYRELYAPQKPQLSIVPLTNWDNAIFEWNPTANTLSYRLQIYSAKSNGCVCDKSLNANAISFDIKLPVGSYYAQISSINNSFTTLGDKNYFNVIEWTDDLADSVVYNNHIYKYFDSNMTWSEAEQYCRSIGGHLATITNQDEQDVVAGLVRNGTRMAYWLDGTDAGHEGTWRWVNGEPFNYSHWSPIQPDNAGGIEHHLAMFRDNGDWNDEYENLRSHIMVMGFVCEFEFENMNLHKAGVFGNNRYFVFENTLSWQDAEAYCESVNGHLVTITSKEEQKFVANLIKGGSRTAYWMGGTDIGSEGEWRWVTGEPFSYSNWSGCQPDNSRGYENCLTMYNQRYPGEWNDIRNSYTSWLYTLGFICEQDFSKIEYDANGGTNAPEILWKSFDMSVNLSNSIPTRNGYTFLGWSTNKYLKNVDYNPGDEYSANEDLKLYAVWRNDGPVKQITFDSILPALLIPPAISTSESEIIIPGYTPTYEGWAFIGWNETGNPSDSVPIYRPGDRISVEDDISLYAIWCASDLGGSLGKEGYYAVYYFPNGGDWDEGNDVIKRSEYQLGLLKNRDDYVFPAATETLHRDGYKLHTKDSDFSTPIFFTGNGAGWNLYGLNINNGYEYPIYPNGESKFTITSDDFAYGTNIILYAAWDPIVKYDMGEGVVVQDFVDVTKESKYKILAVGDTTKYSSNTSETSVDGYDGASVIPRRERFVLTYWTDSSGNKYYPGQEYKITKPTTLYANWRALVEVCSHPNFTEEIIEEASCETNGVTRYICTACGYTYEDNIAPVATGHEFDDGVVTTSPTCTENGEKTYTCSKCGETITEEIISTGHNYVLSETVEPTCTECGHSDYVCEICGDVILFENYALGHDYVAVVTDPTCAAQGYTTYTCSRCGDSYADDYTDALGHDFGEWCDHPDDDTLEIRYCLRCNAFETRDKEPVIVDGIRIEKLTAYDVKLTGIDKNLSYTIRYATGEYANASAVKKGLNAGFIQVSGVTEAVITLPTNGVHTIAATVSSEQKFIGTVTIDESDMKKGVEISIDDLNLRVLNLYGATRVNLIKDGNIIKKINPTSFTTDGLKTWADIELPEAGNYTIRVMFGSEYIEASFDATVPAVAVSTNGRIFTIANYGVNNVSFMRLANGVITTTSEMKTAEDLRTYGRKYFTSETAAFAALDAVNGETTIYTVQIGYASGYTEFVTFEITPTVPVITTTSDSIILSNVQSDLYYLDWVRCAPGVQTSLYGVRHAKGSQVKKTADIDDDSITFTGLTAGTYTLYYLYDGWNLSEGKITITVG